VTRAGLLACLLLAGCGSSVSSEPATTDAKPDTVVAIDTGTVADTAVVDVAEAAVDGGATPLTIEGVGLSAYEGKTIWFLVQNRVEPGLLAKGSGVIVGGAVTVTIPKAMPTDHFGVGLDTFIDLDSDGACTGTEPTWFDIVPTMWGTGTKFTFTPRAESKRTCADIGK